MAPHIRLYSLKELEGFADLYEKAVASQQQPSTQRAAKTAIGRAARANGEQIVTSSHALELLLDKKIADVQRDLPNSPEARAEKTKILAQFRKMKADLIAMRNAVVAYAKGTGTEGKVVKTTKSFEEGVRAWWTKHHEKICERGFDIALFLSAVAICSLLGIGGMTTSIISGVLVGGKPIGDALKSLGKRLLG